DLDHDGYLTPAKLALFRRPFEYGASSASRDHGVRDGAQVQPYGDSDPVMTADTGLTFKVSLDAFLRQSEETFRRLDIRHDGMLDREEVLKTCPLHPQTDQRPPSDSPRQERRHRHDRSNAPGSSN
ncbi:MAG: hypothetical protein HQL37_16500, partial [Alphaproteobacteria bacterium]|nr:hypothetical protein [Alphaproteobacteria bacterium]